MSTVTITDSHQVTVTAVPVNPSPLSALAKYAPGSDLSLILLPDLINALNAPLKTAAATPASLGLKVGKAFDFGDGQPQVSLSAGASAAVHVNAQKDAPLFSDDLYGTQITVKSGEGYLSLALAGTVSGSGSQSQGDITVGLDAGASAAFEFFRKFQVDDTSLSVGRALGEVISNFVVPADVRDLRALQLGDVATSSGKRHLKVSGDFATGVSAVPLASPALPLVGKAVQLNAGASVDVSASFQISSNWQIRTQAVRDGMVELGVYKQHGSDWDLAITASAGIDVSLGSKDLLTALINKLSTDPAADQEQLAAAGLGTNEIDDINSAIASSIDRSIHASFSLDLDGLKSDEAAFLYRIDLDNLNAATSAGVAAALDGDLTVLDRLNPKAEESGLVGPGVTLVRSILTRTKKTGTTFNVNFIGLLNSISLATFISQSQVFHEPVSGDVMFKETASGERIGALTLPHEQTKLRKVIFDSILITTAYSSAGALENAQMTCSDVHFAMHSTTNEHTMSDYLDWFLALGMLTVQGKAALMAGFHGTGGSTCTVRVAFNDAATKAMFLDSNGAPRTAADYISIGRNSLHSLLMPGDANDADGFRREVLASSALWAKFEGQTTIGPVMQREKGWRLDDPRISVLIADYSVIQWWAQAMSSTAGKVAGMQAFLKAADPKTLAANAAFLDRKADLQRHVLDVIKKSEMSFDQPFGLVALASASGPAAIASGVLLSPALNREFGARVQTQTA